MGVASLSAVAAACAPGSVASDLVSPDGIYQQSQGMTLLDVVPNGNGYKATSELAIQTA